MEVLQQTQGWIGIISFILVSILFGLQFIGRRTLDLQGLDEKNIGALKQRIEILELDLGRLRVEHDVKSKELGDLKVKYDLLLASGISDKLAPLLDKKLDRIIEVQNKMLSVMSKKK